MEDLVMTVAATSSAPLGRYRSIDHCEVCGSRELTTALDLGLHPMCDDLVPIGDDRVCRRYPIEILFCDRCRTAHQRYQIPKEDLFPVTYHYRSRFTADVLNGMSELVDSTDHRLGRLKGLRVLDVGCNDGSLLDFFAKKGAKTFGIEPTGANRDAAAKGHVIYPEFFTDDVAARIAAEHGTMDAITFTNVFAHIEDLGAVLRAVKRVCGPDTVLVIENHYLGAVLDGNQFDTFYHEHPRSYSLTSFARIAESLGVPLVDVEFPARYGGNIRAYLGRKAAPTGGKSSTDVQSVMEREKGFGAQFDRMRGAVATWRDTKRKAIESLVATHGPLRAKAFPARAAILVALLGLDERHIAAVHEKPGSLKVGHYVPGTRIPIGSDDELVAARDYRAPVINLAWHIPKEIRGYLASIACANAVVDIVSASDFGQGRS